MLSGCDVMWSIKFDVSKPGIYLMVIIGKAHGLSPGTSHISTLYHDDVMTWKRFPHYRSFVRGSQRSPMDSPSKWAVNAELWCFMCCYSECCWTSSHTVCDLRLHDAHVNIKGAHGFYLLITLSAPVIRDTLPISSRFVSLAQGQSQRLRYNTETNFSSVRSGHWPCLKIPLGE